MANRSHVIKLDNMTIICFGLNIQQVFLSQLHSQAILPCALGHSLLLSAGWPHVNEHNAEAIAEEERKNAERERRGAAGWDRFAIGE